MIQNLTSKLMIEDNQLKQIDMYDSIRALRIYITLSLEQRDHFTIMRKKMIDSVKRFMATKIILKQAYVYFNIYMLKSTFFGVGLIEINDK